MNGTFHLIRLRHMKFSLFILFAIPSTLCSIYIIYSFLRFSSIRKCFHYEILIFLTFFVLLKIFFNISISISFYARGYISPQTESLCRFWQYIDYNLAGCILWCNAIFTFQRYILVFHPNLLRSKRQKILLHYLPIGLSSLYLTIFYVYSVIFLSCKQPPIYTRHLCGDPCLEQMPNLSVFNWSFNVLLPVFVVIFGSIILLTRVLWTRRKMQRNLRNWSKNWKMIIQLLGVAVVYILVWLPLSIVSIIDMLTNSSTLDGFAEDYLYYLTYLTEMSIPIVEFLVSPEINRRLWRRLQPNNVNIASLTIGQHSTH